jgi:hypothetical protein
LKILKEKPINSIRVKTHLDISIMFPLSIKKIDKIFISKGLWKTTWSNFDLSKIHNYHSVKVL